jgi:hypothetical protein
MRVEHLRPTTPWKADPPPMPSGGISIRKLAWRLESRALPPDWGPRRLPVPAAFFVPDPGRFTEN